MTNESTNVPNWIVIYLWVTALITIGATASGYFMPDALLGTWEAKTAAGAFALSGPLGLFLSRNMATFVVTVFGLLQNNKSMIKIILVLRVISDGFDTINNLIDPNPMVAGMGAVMCIIEIFAFMKIK